MNAIKCIALSILCVLLLSSVLLGCSSRPKEQEEGAGSKDTLRICIEAEPSDGDYDGPQVSLMLKSLANVLSTEELTYEIVEIPSALAINGQEERTAFLEKMRVEMMAGNGPDLFILPTLSNFSEDNLFVNVEKPMANGSFADISSYFSADTALPKEVLCGPVMQAGTYRGKQYLLPLRYTFPLSIVKKDSFLASGLSYERAISSTQAYMEELEKTGDIIWKRELTELLASNFIYTLGDIVDYEKQQVLIDPKELKKHIASYSDFAAGIVPESPNNYMDNIGKVALRRELLSADRPMFVSSLGAWILPVLAELNLEDQEFLTIPLTNASGQIAPQVTYFGAVSASCKNPEEAYHFISKLLSQEIQAGKTLAIETAKGEGMVDARDFDSYAGWPVRTDIPYEDIWSTYAKRYQIKNASIEDITFGDNFFTIPYDLFTDGNCLTSLDAASNELFLEYYYAEKPINQAEQEKIYDVLYKHIQAAAME